MSLYPTIKIAFPEEKQAVKEDKNIINIDSFLQVCNNKKFWLWGEKHHQTWKYCIQCKNKFPENATHCIYCNDKWEKHKDENLKNLIFPSRTLRFNDDLILNDVTNDEIVDCCFNHLIGCPSKDFRVQVGKDEFTRQREILPIFDWQKKLYDEFKKEQDNCIIKATGIGGSEFKLRVTASDICCGHEYDNTQVPIIVGPKQGLAQIMLKRFKDLFPFPIYNNRQTCELNNTWLHIFASRNIDSIRSLKNVRELILDEFDFFPIHDMRNVFETISRYLGKSGAKINALSTVKNPYGYCYTLEHEPSQFHILKLHYSIGMGTIFSLEQIEEAKTHFGFEREYGLIYGGTTGNYFDPADVKACEDEYDLRLVKEATTIIGIDSGWSSSWFAVIVASYFAGKIYIMHVERHKSPDPDFMIDRIAELKRDWNAYKIISDGADPQFIYRMKKRFLDYPPVGNYEKKMNFDNPFDYHAVPKELYLEMKVIPTTFTRNVMTFLHQDKMLLRNKNRILRIHKNFIELFSALYEVYVEEGRYKKEGAEHNDFVDSLSEIIDFFTVKNVVTTV